VSRIESFRSPRGLALILRAVFHRCIKALYSPFTSDGNFNSKGSSVIFQSRACVCALIFCLGAAGAARAGNLHVGSSAAWGIAADLYNSSHQLIFHDIGDGAGNINPGSMLDGLSLPHMYCLDLTHDIYLNADYSATTFNNTGYIWNDDPFRNPNSVAVTNADGSLTNAGNIAYLMVNFASSAVSLDQQLALQSAIWSEVYGNHYALIGNPNFSPDENNTIAADQAWYLSHVLAGGNAAYIPDVLWINPSWDDESYAQCQVAYAPGSRHLDSANAVPEPSTFVAVSIMLGLFGAAWVYNRTRLTLKPVPVVVRSR
jgi:hypothetical protein